MTTDNVYLIEQMEGDYHSLSVRWSSDKTVIYIHRNGATSSLDPSDLLQFSRALQALIAGFDEALTETALSLRTSRLARAASAQQPESLPSVPSLENL